MVERHFDWSPQDGVSSGGGSALGGEISHEK